MTVVITCPECNFSKTITEDKIPANTRFVVCPQCRKRFEFSESNPDFAFAQKNQNYSSRVKPSRIESPWEDRLTAGTLNGILQTLRAVLFSPQYLFQSMSYKNGIKEPFAFGLLMGSIGAMFSLFWQFLSLSSETFDLIPELPVELPINLIFLFTLIISPFFITIFIFISSSIIHLCLVISRGANNGFEGTFRVLSFSQAAHILAVIPILGGIIAFFWNVVILLIGLKEIHETSFTRIIAAFLIPVLLIALIAITSIMSTSVTF